MPYPLSPQVPQVFPHPNNNHGTSFGVGKQRGNTAPMRTGHVAQRRRRVIDTTSNINCFIHE